MPVSLAKRQRKAAALARKREAALEAKELEEAVKPSVGRYVVPCVLTWMLPAVLSAALAIWLHLNTLNNEIVWDDRAAVLNNMDLRPETPVLSLLKNDFWGQKMHLTDSHKSYRPVTVLTLRWNFATALMSGGRGAEPFFYHAWNIGLHGCATAFFVLFVRLVLHLEVMQGIATPFPASSSALSSSSSVPAQFPGMTALLAGVLFAVHPVHTEPVASLVGRADVLCGALALGGLLAYTSAAAMAMSTLNRRIARMGDSSTPRVETRLCDWTGAMSIFCWLLLGIAFMMATLAAFSKELGATTFGLFVAHEIIESVVYKSKTKEGHPVGSDTPSILGLPFKLHSAFSFKPLFSALGSFAKDFTAQRGDDKNKEKEEEGRRKSTGTLPASNWASLSSVSRSLLSSCVQSPSLATLRGRVSAAVGAVAVVLGLHLSLHGEQRLYAWTILENDVSLLDSRLSRVLSYGHIHVQYMVKLLYPFRLCYDHGHDCVPRVERLLDPINAWTVLLYATIFACGNHAIVCRSRPMLWALALLIIPFVPASHIFFPIGTIVGERLLYLPSAGFCLALAVFAAPFTNRILIALTVRHWDDPNGLVAGILEILGILKIKSSGRFKIKRIRRATNSGNKKNVGGGDGSGDDDGDEDSEGEEEKKIEAREKKEVGDDCNNHDNVCGAGGGKGNSNGVVHKKQRLRNQSRSTSSRNTGGDKSRLASFSATLSVCVAIAIAINIMGRHTLARNQDWASELSLFESAMKICPRSLKVLNNLANTLLNDIPNGTKRSIELLENSLDMYGDFPTALYNIGLAHHFLGETNKSVPYFEKCIALQPAYHKCRASLGRAHLNLGISLRDGPQQNKDLGEVLMESALELLDGALKGGVLYPFIYYNKANALMELGNYDKAVEIYNHCLLANAAAMGLPAPGVPSNHNLVLGDALDPAGAYNGMGICLRKQGRLDDADWAWREGIKWSRRDASKPRKGMNVLGMMDVSSLGGAYVYDEEGFVLRHEGDATGFELYANMAGMYADIGNYSVAMEYYNAALSMQPGAALVVNNLGYMHELMGNLDLAAQHYRRALELLLPERHYQIEVNLANLERRMADEEIKTEQSRMRAAERGAVDRGGNREGDEASVTRARGVGRNGPGGLLVKERPAE